MLFVIVNSKAHGACADNHSKIINSQSKRPHSLKDKFMKYVQLKHTWVQARIISLIELDIFHISQRPWLNPRIFSD